MTDTDIDTSTRPDGSEPDADTGGGTDQPGQAPKGPASGGEGAAGAGGPDGFGTGT